MGDELENIALHSEALVALTVPGTEALVDPYWKAATQRKYDSLMTNLAWSLVLANGATADNREVALCSESQRRRKSDKVQGTF